MTWLAWRQFRARAAVALVALAVVVLLLAVTGPRLAHDFAAGGLADCAAGRETDTGSLTCGDLVRGFIDRYPLVRLLGTALVVLPAMIGAFWGAPLVAGELEAGTHQVAWVQSVTRTRWLAVKLSLVGAVAVVVTAILSLAFTWWASSSDRLGSRISPAHFAQRGVTPVAYAAFALVLGTAIGSVIRRTLPAMATTLAVFFAVRQAVESWARPRILDPIEISHPTFTFYTDEPAGRVAADSGWVLSTQTLDSAGQVLSSGGTIRDDAAATLCGLPTASPTKAQLDACGESLGLHDVVTMFPADRFWTLQAAEAAIFVVLTGAVGAFCFWWVRQRIG
ncbi:MAG TPA: hypothetical protein VFP06_15745 [Acidimicrobiales bacterium]|nr:hypothetical protein [Acidimicrobiales bacterium]